tara:strand:+ start:320 stop:469 length:150 start_codon:yes stop_codon:yes gene_type:complete
MCPKNGLERLKLSTILIFDIWSLGFSSYVFKKNIALYLIVVPLAGTAEV